jgi:hypothetical protein
MGGVELVTEFVAGPAGAGAERVPALDHEAGDHPMEDRPVVERLLGGLPGPRVGPFAGALRQFDEVANGLGSVVREEPQDNVALVGPQRGGERIGHG